jgi:hypothetical protein
MRIIANTKIELKHVGDGIILLVNDVLQPVRWQVYERRIAGDITYRGGYIPKDKAWVYYVYGRDGRRYRYLCLMSLPDGRFRLGTRHDFGAALPISIRCPAAISPSGRATARHQCFLSITAKAYPALPAVSFSCLLIIC